MNPSCRRRGRRRRRRRGEISSFIPGSLAGRKLSGWFISFTLFAAMIPHEASSKSHRPELVVLNESGTSIGGVVYARAMGDAQAAKVLGSAMRFAARILRADPSSKRRIALIISTLPGDEISSTTSVDDISVIEISQQYLSRFPGNITSELSGLIYEGMSNALLNGVGVAPAGLTDGVAKFVRLRAGLAPGDQFKPERFNTSARDPWEQGGFAAAHFIDYQ